MIPRNFFFSSKTIAINHDHYLRRSRFDCLLETALQKSAVTVIAGIGFGKTQAVYSYLWNSEDITTWIQLTSSDNICTRFWGNIIGVIQLYNAKFAKKMRNMGFPDSAPKINLFIDSLVQARVDGKRVCAVFDDFHLMHEKKILHLIETIIRAEIPHIRIILISRNEPDINLNDLLVRNKVFCIREADLCFDRNDIHQYFEMQGICMSPQYIVRVYEQTNGWIFAIRLLILTIKQGIVHEEYAIDAMKSNVFKWMENKFFADFPREIQHFLVKLSLFHSLPFELVKSLAQDNDALVAQTLNINSFLRYDSFANTYCMHHLFPDFLKKKQDMLTAQEITDSYLLAADWYAASGYQIEAIRYYGQAGEYGKMLDIALTFPTLFPEEVALLLPEILGKVSKEDFEAQPHLKILQLRVVAQTESKEAALAGLATLKEKYEALPLTIQNRSVLCEIDIVEAIISHLTCTVTNHFGFVKLFQEAYEYMPQGSNILKGKVHNYEIDAYVCRVSNPDRGDMENYIKAVSAAIPYTDAVMNGYMYGLDDLAWAELLYFRFQTKEAEGYALQALTKARKKRQWEIELRALFYLLRIAIAMGDCLKVTDLCNRLEQQHTHKPSGNKVWQDIVFGWFYATIGVGEQVACWIKSSFVKENIDPFLLGCGNLVTARYYTAEKCYDELLCFLETPENASSFDGFLMGKISLFIYKSICLYHTGNHQEALDYLHRAYALALPNGLTMFFIEMGNEMVALAKLGMKTEGCPIPQDWLQNILRKASTYAKRISHVASDYKNATRQEGKHDCKLTKKEREYLTDLCHGASVAEIALHHEVSTNYLNNRVQTIYTKLGAQNIKDAIHIATLMKLVT